MDDPVRAAAERLLRSLESATGFMEEPPPRRPDPGADAPDAPLPARIGPYTPIERLGEGGFGIVYRARQTHPVEREVAVKVLRSGLESAQVLARFNDERRFLARLDHPDVVRVLDAGATEDGRLYVVMDLVPGVPITAFVRDAGLSVEERLRLFVRVCRAVHAVHQRAVIHRDLKPSNIVVVRGDDGPRPRIIDFGIAAALDAEDRAGWTKDGAPIGTPRYASPEQSSSSGSVDTRTDVYSLGVLLGEMLSGATPRPHASGAETTATPPSRAASEAGDAGMARRLRGDLDRIVLRATAWEPARRYDSAAGLADDVERHLAGMPVLASPPGRVYAARKFIGRHRFASAAGALAVLALVAGLLVSLVATGEANRQRRIAESNSSRAAFIGSFLLQTIERNADPDARGGDIILDEASLEALAAEAIAGLDQDPETMLDLLETIGQIQHKVGHFEAAAANFALAGARARTADGGPTARSVRLQIMQAMTLESDHRNKARVLELKQQAALDAATLFDEDDPRLLSIRMRLPIALDELERIVARLEADPDARPDDVITGLSTAYWRHEFGPEPVRGLPYARRWHERALERYGPGHSLTINAMTTYASAESVHGSPRAALPLLVEAVARSGKVLGPDHHHTESARRVLARVYGEVGEPLSGIPHALEHEALTRRLHGEGSVQHAGALRVLGTLHALAGQSEEARDLLTVSLEAMRGHWPATHNMVTAVEARLADVLVDLGDYDGADALASHALGAMHPRSMAQPVALAASAKARAMIARGDRAGAAALIADTLARYEAEGVTGRPVAMLRDVLEP
ncbi:MAG: serine/threonine protein kinase [Phycisphaerales bacterium]|nr:MAG: serine/threonine protein kinase [Phycisphaerales bacterium]